MSNVDAEVIEGFVREYLWARYDDAVDIPECHREWWQWYCAPVRNDALAAPRGHGKAQPLDARVLTPTGWSQIGDLRVGDTVMGRRGPTKVTHLHPISQLPMYEVTTRDGRKTLCNEDHLWTVKIPSNSSKEITKPIRELLPLYATPRLDKRNGKEYTEYRCLIPLPNAVEFTPTGKLPIEAYTLGAWLGDGHSAAGRMTSADPEIFQWFDCEVSKTKSGKYLYQCEGLTKRLRMVGVQNNKHIPRAYLYASVEDRLAVIQGLMDTDGSCHEQGKIAYFSNTRWSLIEGFVHLVRSLGGIANVLERQSTCNGKVFDSWVVSIKMPKGMNPFRLKRKAEKWLGDWVEYTYIVDIKKVEPRLARCITVEAKDGLYITDDFLVTHNSTSITFAATLADALFGEASFFLIVTATEELVKNFIGELKKELQENEKLHDDFAPEFLKETETEIIVRCTNGVFRILGKGSEQKIRGIKWRGRRPDRVIMDDGETDEAVESAERRRKFRRWFQNALMQVGARKTKYRIIGTILHLDSLLENLIKRWDGKRYAAHNPDMSMILWPEMFPRERLIAIRSEFAQDGNLEGYSQEYLNDPVDVGSSMFKKAWLRQMNDEDRRFFQVKRGRTFYVSCDLAITKQSHGDYTVFLVAGVGPDGIWNLVDCRRGRWDGFEIMEQLFELHEVYDPQLFVIEGGTIEKSIMPFLNAEMNRRKIFPNIQTVMQPTGKDKTARAKGVQGQLRAGAWRFDHEADWYANFEDEILRFPKTRHDDQVDCMSMFGSMADQVTQSQTDKEVEDEDYEREAPADVGSSICGY